MNRNIYHRIEVCFPIYDEGVKHEIIKIIDLLMHDNVQAVTLDRDAVMYPLPRANLRYKPTGNL